VTRVRLVYFGSPAMAVAPLVALVEAGHEVVLVVSNPDRRRGRRGSPTPTAVKAAALDLGIPVSEDPDDSLEVGADLGVVVAFGRILRPHVVNALPMVNLHFSLLPRWRGAAPVERAILTGDDRSGVCVMAVEKGLDTGGVYDCVELDIGARTTAEELRSELVAAGTELLVRTLAEPLGAPRPQSDVGVTYAEKLSVEDLRIDWSRPALEADRQVRVGGAWTTLHGRRLKVLAASPLGGSTGSAGSPGTVEGCIVSCGEGSLRLEQVQPEGKGPRSAEEWLRGARLAPDDLLGT
jgi:methionyl-tRNA formyltransferase